EHRSIRTTDERGRALAWRRRGVAAAALAHALFATLFVDEDLRRHVFDALVTLVTDDAHLGAAMHARLLLVGHGRLGDHARVSGVEGRPTVVRSLLLFLLRLRLISLELARHLGRGEDGCVGVRLVFRRAEREEELREVFFGETLALAAKVEARVVG